MQLPSLPYVLLPVPVEFGWFMLSNNIRPENNKSIYYAVFTSRLFFFFLHPDIFLRTRFTTNLSLFFHLIWYTRLYNHKNNNHNFMFVHTYTNCTLKKGWTEDTFHWSRPFNHLSILQFILRQVHSLFHTVRYTSPSLIFLYFTVTVVQWPPTSHCSPFLPFYLSISNVF
jgi:hypothetical protein